MRLLIDTQVFIWLINEDEKLGKKTLQLLHDTANQLSLSYFSIFEMTIKCSVGRLDYDPSVIGDLPKMGIELLFPNEDTLRGYVLFNPENRDPFDNALISVALQEKYTLVTSDTKILAVSDSRLKLINASE
jgi:PIN domain nuclease of toxin-antitoxin system